MPYASLVILNIFSFIFRKHFGHSVQAVGEALRALETAEVKSFPKLSFILHPWIVSVLHHVGDTLLDSLSVVISLGCPFAQMKKL